MEANLVSVVKMAACGGGDVCIEDGWSRALHTGAAARGPRGWLPVIHARGEGCDHMYM